MTTRGDTPRALSTFSSTCRPAAANQPAIASTASATSIAAISSTRPGSWTGAILLAVSAITLWIDEDMVVVIPLHHDPWQQWKNRPSPA
jgi:hypothetical protein